MAKERTWCGGNAGAGCSSQCTIHSSQFCGFADGFARLSPVQEGGKGAWIQSADREGRGQPLLQQRPAESHHNGQRQGQDDDRPAGEILWQGEQGGDVVPTAGIPTGREKHREEDSYDRQGPDGMEGMEGICRTAEQTQGTDSATVQGEDRQEYRVNCR